MNVLQQDVRYAIRLFLRQRGFTAVVVLALALGIASATAVFSMVNAVLIHGLPLAHADRLVMLWQQDLASGRDRITLTGAEYRHYADAQRSFDAMAAMRGVGLSVALGETPAAADGLQVSDGFLDTLGITPIAGRTFSSDRAAAATEALITFEFWQRSLGGAQDVVGQRLMLRAGFTGAGPRSTSIDGSYTIVGILPAGLRLPYRSADVWTVLRGEADATGLLVFGRLRPRVTVEQAAGEVVAAAARLIDRTPDRNRAITAWLVTLREEDSGDITPTLLLLVASVALLSLIICANVGNMVLARHAERRSEFAVRQGLGATRWRLAQQLTIESALLAIAGATVGVVLASWIVRAIALVGPATIPRLQDVRVDAWSLGAALVTAGAMTLLFGLVPAMRMSRTADRNPLTQRSGNTAATGRLGQVLVTIEVALAFVVLVGTGVVIKSARALESAAIGYDPSNVLTFRVSLPQSQYNERPARLAFIDTLLQRLGALPGVTSAGAVSILPQMDANASVSLDVEGAPAPADRPTVRFRLATPGYFDTLGIRTVRGRTFERADQTGGAVVVSRAMADRFWPDTDPVGRRIRLAIPALADRWLPVVGVVDDVRQWINTPADPTIYLFDMQQPSFAFAIRATQDAAALSRTVAQAVRQIDSQQPIFDVQTMDQRLDRSQQLTYARFRTVLMVAFGCAALVLSILGIYGVVRYSVLQRMQEFGIRVALGASASDVMRIVLRQALGPVAAGAAIGIAISMAGGQVLATMLYDSTGAEPPIVAAVFVLIVALAVIAAAGPARRASLADPRRALRAE